MSRLRSFDSVIAKPISRLPLWLKEPFTVLGMATSPPVWAAILLVSIALQPAAINRSATIAILLLVPLATISKFAFKRKRPETIYAGSMRIKSYSFPSSHSYASMLVCSFFALGLLSVGGWLLCSLLIILAVMVGISRVYLGAHYPSDVLGGWLLGIALSMAVSVCL